MVPVLSIPALVVLFSAASGYREEDNQPPWSEKIKNGIARMDLVGIILFTAGFGLIDYNTDVWYRETGTGEFQLEKLNDFFYLIPRSVFSIALSD